MSRAGCSLALPLPSLGEVKHVRPKVSTFAPFGVSRAQLTSPPKILSNRVLALLVATLMVKRRHGRLLSPSSAPLLAFAPCAMSNTFSSWAQYTALKYVTFPVQTLFKSSKIIPVMLMGR